MEDETFPVVEVTSRTPRKLYEEDSNPLIFTQYPTVYLLLTLNPGENCFLRGEE